MKTTININGKETEIELTADQVANIKKASEKITDRVKSFEDALEIVGASDDQKILLYYNGHDTSMLASVALAKLSIIAKALNEGWQPDWSDDDQYKYYPWFNKLASARGFSYYGYDCAYSYSGVGSRLVYKTSELAEYAGKQFNQLYNDLFSL